MCHYEVNTSSTRIFRAFAILLAVFMVRPLLPLAIIPRCCFERLHFSANQTFVLFFSFKIALIRQYLNLLPIYFYLLLLNSGVFKGVINLLCAEQLERCNIFALRPHIFGNRVSGSEYFYCSWLNS